MTDEPRKWLFDLTADEWLHLASEGVNSAVPPCCGNISDFRENLNALATCQEPDGGMAWMMAGAVLDSWYRNLDHFESDPELKQFPLLARVIKGCMELRPDVKAEEADDNHEN